MSFFSTIFSKKSSNQELEKFILEAFGVKPKSIRVYETACTHKSISSNNNERLEFLGDTILSSIVAGYIFKLYPNKTEGELSKLISKVVSRNQLNELGEKINLHQHIQYIKQENGHKNILGNTLEALIGAIYLDKGYHKTEKSITKLIEKHLSLDEVDQTEKDYKSQLHIWGQQNQQEVLFDTKQIDNTHSFTCDIVINKEIISSEKGESKKKAEQKAAKIAFKTILSNQFSSSKQDPL